MDDAARIRAMKRAKYECHGMTHSAERRVWDNMRQRCYNPNNPAYKNYGGRGIGVCKRWRHSFTAFYQDVGPRPSPKHSLDRINNDGDYEPSNVRWALMGQQLRNTRKNVYLTHNGETLCAREWSRRTGLDHKAIIKRIRRGLPSNEVLSTGRVRNVHSKLSVDQVTEIKVMLNNGSGLSAIARQFGITPHAVACIRDGKSYAYIPIPKGGRDAA